MFLVVGARPFDDEGLGSGGCMAGTLDGSAASAAWAAACAQMQLDRPARRHNSCRDARILTRSHNFGLQQHNDAERRRAALAILIPVFALG
jgi:hypothetical protein